MSAKKFVSVYVPFLIAGVFVIAFSDPSEVGYMVNQPKVAPIYLLAIASGFVIGSFGLGAVFYSIGYVFSHTFCREGPSYLKTVLNTHIAIVLLIILGTVGNMLLPAIEG